MKSFFSLPKSTPLVADVTARPRIPSDLLPLRDCELDGALFFMPTPVPASAQRRAA